MSTGWRIYDAAADFARLGLPNARWRLSDVNKQYSLCNTYPPVLVVPASLSNNDIWKVVTLLGFHPGAYPFQIAGFRSRGRVPTVVYRHPNDTVLIRCAQPRTGFTGTRCEEDERLFHMTLHAMQDPRYVC
jgi:hypothetical protein